MFRLSLTRIICLLGLSLFSLGSQAEALTVNDKVAAELLQIRSETSFPESVGKKFETIKTPLQAVIDGGDVNAADAEGKTALMHTVAAGDMEFIAYLLFKNADTTIKDKAGKTAADYTTDNDIKQLLKADAILCADMSPADQEAIRKQHTRDWSDSFIGIYNNGPEEVAKIMKAGWKNTDAKQNDAIHNFLWYGDSRRHLANFITMIKGGADVNRKHKFLSTLEPADGTALHIGVSSIGASLNEDEMNILLMAGADPNVMGVPIEHNGVQTTPLCVPYRRGLLDASDHDRMLIAAGASKSYLEGLVKVSEARKLGRPMPATKELFLRVLDECASNPSSLSSEEKKVIFDAALKYNDEGLMKELAERKLVPAAGKDSAPTLEAEEILRMAAFQDCPEAHAAAKALVKAKKWTDKAETNFLLAIAAENPSEIKRLSKEIGSFAKFVEDSVPKSQSGYVVQALHYSPFALIRSPKIAKLVLSLEEGVKPIRVNWNCMSPALLKLYLNAKMDMNAPKSNLAAKVLRRRTDMLMEHELIRWHKLNPEMVEILKNQGVKISEEVLTNDVDKLPLDMMEYFIKQGIKPGESAMNDILYAEDIDTIPQKIELLAKAGLKAEDYHIRSSIGKPEAIKALVRIGVEKESSLADINARIATLEKAPLGSSVLHSYKGSKSNLTFSLYRDYCVARDILEGKISSEAAPVETPDEDEKAKPDKKKKTKGKKGDKKKKKGKKKKK